MCKEGITTSASYCVKPDESSSICEGENKEIPTPGVDKTELKLSCESFGGKFLESYNECEGHFSKDYGKECQNLGGKFSPCESACRHNIQPGPCIQVCIPVCKF